MPYDTIYIGGTLENGVISGWRFRFWPADSTALTYTQSVSLTGEEIPSDELYCTLAPDKASSVFAEIDPHILFLHGNRLTGNPPWLRDFVISGNVTLKDSGGQTLLTSGKQTLVYPETVPIGKFFKSLWKGVTRATPVWYERRTDSGVILRRELYYFQSLIQKGRLTFDLTAQSVMGRMAAIQHDGALYTMFRPGYAYLRQILFTMCSLAGIPNNAVSVDYELGQTHVYGYLPASTVRDNLQLLANAYGFIILQRQDGSLLFTPPDNAVDLAPELPLNRIQVGGFVDDRTGTTYRTIQVTETAYIQTDEDRLVTLFDNSTGYTEADNLRIVFDTAPVYDLTAEEGLRLISYGENAAVVSGIGKLKGRAYTKLTATASYDGDPDADENAVLALPENPVITALISAQCAERARSWYNDTAIISFSFLRETEKPGDLLRFLDPFDVERVGYITDMKGTVTGLDYVSGTFAAGFNPGDSGGGGYDSVILLTGYGTWDPAEILGDADAVTVMVILIGGGNGGAAGAQGPTSSDSLSIDGGQAGTPGSGGKFRRITELTIERGQTYFYACGAGGAGGRKNTTGDYERLNPDKPDETPQYRYVNTPGSAGTATFFTADQTYSSDTGSTAAFGYTDPITQTTYAAFGPEGVNGGAAASKSGDSVTRPSITGPDEKTYTAGEGGTTHEYTEETGYIINYSVHETSSAFQYGWGSVYAEETVNDGLGGGAAVGANGGDGEKGTHGAGRYFSGDGDVDRYIPLKGGDGGNGGNALNIFKSQNPGAGGQGGHGGGAPGKGGSANRGKVWAEDGFTQEVNPQKILSDNWPPTPGADGSPGLGSDGQDGAPGCILIYYSKPT